MIDHSRLQWSRVLS